MLKRLCLLIIALSSIVNLSYCEIPTYDNQPSSAFLRNWLLCGPFPNPAGAYNNREQNQPGFYFDYLQAHGGETNLSVQAGQKELFENTSAEWIEYQSDTNSVDLDKAVSIKPYVLSYAYCEITSAEEKPCFIAMGSNDGARVWFNGEQILDLPVERGLRSDDNIIPIVLKKGRNTLLLKIAETQNLWGFCCRLVPFDLKRLGSDQSLFRVYTNKAGQASLSYTGSKSLIGKVLKKIDLEISPSYNPSQVIWKKQWSKEIKTALDIASKEYGEYLLKINITLLDDSQQCITMPFFVGQRMDYNLFANSKTDYSIVIGENASESEQWVAKELQHWLKEICGAELSIKSDAEPQTPNQIIIGLNRHSRTLLSKEQSKELKELDESFTYRNVGPSIVIWGGKARGTMYGVFSFLEKELGCRWYTPSVSVIPSRERYTFHHLNHSELPGIRVRNDFYFEAFNPTWAARNRVNGAMGYRKQPGGVESYWAVHTFYPMMPPSEFYEKHPEYYSLIDGKRVHHRAQLCLTNPDVLRIITERTLEKIRQNPENLIYSVSQNDWAGPCQCEACQAIAKREESESGPIIWFVNQVAEAVEKEFPDKFIGTLAYQYTRKPCKTLHPRHNVVVRFCSIECCFAHDFEHCPENVSFVKDIEGWSAIAPKLYIWDYVVNFSHYVMPYPNFNVLQPNIQFFRKHNSIGIMEQAAYQSRGGEFSELRSYLISKLLWNPDCDVQAVINDFMYGYYGRSGQYIRNYFDLLHGQITPDTHIHLGLQPDDPLFSDEFITQADLIFDQAEIAADNDEIKKRVEMTRLPLMYLKCKRDAQKAIQDGTYQRFSDIAQREEVLNFAEAGVTHREAFHSAMKNEMAKE